MFDTMTPVYFWGFLFLYGGVMYAVSPRAVTVQSFFRGTDARGNPVTFWWLTLSIFITWIFAKSVTNAANLGHEYGLVGGLAYAVYWLSIPFAGVAIYRLRTRAGATGLVPFLISKYGRFAALGFTVAVLIRLFNEIWSNTAVVGGFFGDPGQFSYYAAALLFTLFTLAYSIKGGLRSSIVTDAIQSLIFVFFLGLVLFTIIPVHGIERLATTGSFSLAGGVDLLLVALLQVLSYPFHDPVLTDRAFLTHERTMLRAFVISGLLGFIVILVFSLVGIHASLSGLAIGNNAPAAVGRALGLATFFFMTAIMITSAGSTLDSTFSSLSRSMAYDTPVLRGLVAHAPSIRTGVWVMIAFAILGNLPLFATADILKATTISGTMVIGLAPVFLLQGWVRYSPWSFHLSFWPGVGLGVLLATGAVPGALAIGHGKYATLLGVNAYGLLICTAGFLLPLAAGRVREVFAGVHSR